MEKRAMVVAGDQIIDVVVLPGATANDILQQAHLPAGYFLAERDGLPYGGTELVYERIRPGTKLYASPEARVAQGSGGT